MKTAVIAIYYLSVRSKTNIMQRGEFKLGRKNPEQVAFEFWEQIQRDMPVELKLVKVLFNGEDISELVRNLIQ